MTAFPGIMHKWALHRAFFLQLLTGCFQVFDVCSLYLSNAMAGHLPSSRLWTPVFLRLPFMPSLLLGQWHPESCFIWGSDTGRLLIVALMVLSNSFVASCAMMYGPISCKVGSEVAGNPRVHDDKWHLLCHLAGCSDSAGGRSWNSVVKLGLVRLSHGIPQLLLLLLR